MRASSSWAQADPELFPTLGTIGHQTGDCQPCFYVHTRPGCHYGVWCRFCHGDHPPRRKEVPGKPKRVECKSLVDRLLPHFLRTGATFAEAVESLRSAAEFPHDDALAARYALKLLKRLYKEAGLDATLAPEDEGVADSL